MSLANSKIVPAAFWVGFLVLGFATSLGGPSKHHVARVEQSGHHPAVAGEAVVAQTERPAVTKASERAATQD